MICTGGQREVDYAARGVAVNMSPCHGEDRQFKSDPGSPFFYKNRLGSSVGRATD